LPILFMSQYSVLRGTILDFEMPNHLSDVPELYFFKFWKCPIQFSIKFYHSAVVSQSDCVAACALIKHFLHFVETDRR
jgi:hypothetical protein